MGIMSGRKISNNRRKFKASSKKWKKRNFDYALKADPLEGASQAKAIVLEKVEKEAKQPNSAMRKCAKVQLIKNGKPLIVFLPGNLAQKYVDEHDEVIIERIGGKQGRSKGDMGGVRYQVIQVNDQPLLELVRGKIEKGRR